MVSVTLHKYPTPAPMPVNIPVALVTPSNVKDKAPVPPLAVIVTTPSVNPLQVIFVVIAALALIAAGSTTSIVPETGPHKLVSVTLHK